MNNFSITGIYTDLYELAMAQVYFLQGRSHHRACFDYFFRKSPFESGFTIFAGLGDLIGILENLHFTDDDLDYLKELGFHIRFRDYLKGFQFKGSVYAVREGEVIFPTEPVARIEGNIIEAQIIETVLLNILNFESLIATKAARIRSVAGKKMLVDFGLRRAHALGGYHAARAAIVGGFNATSNVLAAKDFAIPAVGTMAHSFIQSYESELVAFREFAINNPNHCVLLVDTYDTLHSGITNAIIVGHEMKQRGKSLQGIRLDSGDLAYLSKQARQMLDDAGLQDVTITASNELDEWVIKSLMDQNAPIDIFGVGTSLVTGKPEAALDGVYKLACVNDSPRIKLSENRRKITLPGKKQVYRVLSEDGSFFGADAICLQDECVPPTMYHPFEADKHLDLKNRKTEALLQPVMINGEATAISSLMDIAQFCQRRLALLPEEHRRFSNPHIYKIGISEKLRKERERLKNFYTQ